MNIYEEQYQLLKQNGAQGWAGEGYKRAHQQLGIILQELEQRNILLSPGASFLELGCGNGAMSSQHMAERGYEVSGVDISQTAIEWAKERFLTLGLKGIFIQGDVCNLQQFKADSYDVIFDGSCFHCLIGKQRELCLAEIRHLIKPEGIAVISTMTGKPKDPENLKDFDSDNYHLMRNGQPWRTLKPLTLLEEEISVQGFSIIYTHLNHNPWWDHATICCKPI
ncbi:class I SAM-dependent methyltransferase [Buttiauxella noackiae]|uniref:class I SAM-dependent methyltransferase n=1 Tax=Buttiauxella noackiae TaxID=82992 RepID=UPI0035A741D6